MSSSPLPPEAGPALMRRVALRYIDAESGAPRKIVLDKNTHLGRARFPKHLSPRELPEVFKKAEIAVVVDAGDRNISRNHALLVQEGESWTLYDLNSMNGTAVNGERLDGGKGRPLGAMDRICFGARTKLVFSLVDAPENSALLVGNPGWFPMLRGVKNDLCSMEGALEVRKQFGGNISRLYEASATREAILGMLDTFASINSEDSVFVFYYSGHGSPGGLDVCKGTLSPDDLYGSLGNMRGEETRPPGFLPFIVISYRAASALPGDIRRILRREALRRPCHRGDAARNLPPGPSHPRLHQAARRE